MSEQSGNGAAMSQETFQSPESAVPAPANTNAPTRNPDPAPVSLLRKRRPAREIPREHLGPALAAVEAIEVLTQAPAAIAMQSVLSGISLSVQYLADVETLDGTAPACAYFLTVAASGERKSACDRYALRAIRSIEQEQLQDFPRRMAGYKKSLALFEAEQAQILRASHDVIDKTADLDALGAPPTEPIDPHILFEDVTIEGVCRHFDHGQPTIGIFSDEGGMFFGGHAMKSENRLKTATALSKLWNGSAVNRVRASGPVVTYFNRRVTVHLMVQGRIAEAALADELLVDQGLYSRMLIAWPESNIGHRLIPMDLSHLSQVRRTSNDALAEFEDRLAQLWDLAPFDAKECTPRTLPLSAEARALLVRFANHVEAAQSPGEPYHAITGFASKAAEQAARLFAILTLFADPKAETVGANQMVWGIGLMNWYLSEAERLLNTGTIDDTTRDAESLRSWLVDTRTEQVISLRMIARYGPSRIRQVGEIRRLMKVIVAHYWAIPVPGAKVDGVTCHEAWRIVRA